MKFFFICILTCVCLSANAQTHRIDSLKNQIAITTNQKKKLETILTLCNERNSLNTDKLKYYAQEAKSLAQLQKDKVKTALAEFNIAYAFSKDGKSDTALKISEDQLKELRYSGTEKEVYGRLSALKGVALFKLSKQKEGIDFLFKLLGEAEKINDTLTQLSALNSLGSIYMAMGQLSEANNWFQKALDRLPGAIPPYYMEHYGILTGNKCIFFLHLYETTNKKPDADSCFYYSSKGIEIGEKIENLYIQSNCLLAKGLMAGYQKQTAAGEMYLQKGLQLRKLIGDPLYILSDMSVLSSFYSSNGQFEKGIALSKEGIELAEKNKINTVLPPLYFALAENYKAAGYYEKYGATLKKLVGIKDSIYKINSATALAEMQTKYEVQKKENTIIEQKYNLTRKNYFIYGIAGILAITLLFGYAFFRNRKKTQQLRIQQLEAQQKQKTIQAVLQAEEEERKRIAGDLHDSVAQKIVVAKMNLESLGNKINEMTGPEQKIYQNITSLLDESATEVRNLSHSMMPQAFSHSGLTDAVKDFLDKVPVRDLHIHFDAEGDFTAIKETTSLMIYRIIQEAVQNVLKHAKATTLDVAMIAENNECDITIEDNGVGFDTTAAALKQSTGLKNIQSRIDYLNGKLEISSKPGKGTMLVLYVPLNHS
jgi:two-component system, NarL family, sensor kinase